MEYFTRYPDQHLDRLQKVNYIIFLAEVKRCYILVGSGVTQKRLRAESSSRNMENLVIF